MMVIKKVEAQSSKKTLPNVNRTVKAMDKIDTGDSVAEVAEVCLTATADVASFLIGRVVMVTVAGRPATIKIGCTKIIIKGDNMIITSPDMERIPMEVGVVMMDITATGMRQIWRSMVRMVVASGTAMGVRVTRAGSKAAAEGALAGLPAVLRDRRARNSTTGNPRIPNSSRGSFDGGAL